MKRALALLVALTLCFCACGQNLSPTSALIPTSTPSELVAPNTPVVTVPVVPPATPTQYAPGADGVATAYLRAWQSGDFLGMYSLLSRTSQSMLDQATFVNRYQDAQNEATVVAVEIRPFSILQDMDKAQFAFRVTWKTALLGDIERDMTMPLVYEGGRWTVSWSDALILPELGGGNRLQLEYHVPARANLYDRNGLGLAVEGTAVTIGIVPVNLGEAGEAALLPLLSQMLGETRETVRSRYASSDPTWYIPLGDVPQDVVAPHVDVLRPWMNAGAIQLRERKTRLYREGGVAPHVTGYTAAISAEQLDEWKAKGYRGDERVGATGLEAWAEPYLGGGHGGTLYLVSPNGDRLGVVLDLPARPNRSIYATLDKNFQIRVEQALQDAIVSHPDGHAGAVVVMDVNTGQVLAMASYPDFDPNLFDPINPESAAGLRTLLSHPGRPLINRASQGTYPAASVFKIVTMSAALLSGAYLPDTRYTCTGTWDGLGPNFIKGDWLAGGHGNITLRQAITYSCDPYFYQVGLTLDRVDSFLIPETARAFGLGSATGVQGISEGTGLIPDPQWKMETYGEGWGTGDSVNMAIGQGFVIVNPLQIARMLAAVANGGTLYRPQVVLRIGEGGDAPEEALQPEVVGSLPLSAEQLAILQESLYAVTIQSGGTAEHRFRNMPVPVAGKTGTAEVPPIIRDDGTLNDQPTAWFAAYAPAAPTPDLVDVPDQPEIAIAVVVEHAGEGSAVAAPIVRRIVELYYGIQPLTSYPW